MFPFRIRNVNEFLNETNLFRLFNYQLPALPETYSIYS